MSVDLSTMTTKQLKDYAKENNITIKSNTKKIDIINQIKEKNEIKEIYENIKDSNYIVNCLLTMEKNQLKKHLLVNEKIILFRDIKTRWYNELKEKIKDNNEAIEKLNELYNSL